MGSGEVIHTLAGHTDEVLDVNFDSTGNKLVSASADRSARVFDVVHGSCTAILQGHHGEVSKALFSPSGTKVLTASSDKTAILWNAEGHQIQTLDGTIALKGHDDEIFSCAFNYEGDTIITGSKDNTCKIWLDNDKYKAYSQK